MWPINQIEGTHAKMKSSVQAAQKLLADLDARIAEIQRDGSRHPNWIAEKERAARAETAPKIGALIRDIEKEVGAVHAQRRFWGSKTMLLSQQMFDPNPAHDAAIRTRYMNELSLLNADELKLVAEAAVAAKNLPLVWQAHLAGRKRSDPEWRGIPLDDVVVPEQTVALNLIDECGALASIGHNTYRQAEGKSLTGLEKLEAARAQQSLRASV